MTTQLKLFILGAGAPHRGDIPAALREPRSGTSMLQWLLDSAGCSMENCIFVAGYQAEAIRQRYPQLSVIENADWATTGSGASLLATPLPKSQPVLVSYSDIMFRDSVPSKLAATGADIAVAWDSLWKHRYASRSSEDLLRCEKVIVQQNRALRLGADLPVDWANGEFVGLVWFSSKAVKALEQLKAKLTESLKKRHLSEYIEYLRAMGLTIAAVDVAGDWAEFNEPRDIAHFVLGTKAETLSRLRGMVRHAVIQDQIAFSVEDWVNQPDGLLKKIQERFLNQSLVVRSSARSEDAFHSSNAGGYDSVLNVDPCNGLTEAIQRVITSYGNAADDDQVLIQPMVADVAISGVAFTRTLEHGAPWYVINYETAGNTEAITSGVSDDHRTLVMRRNWGINGDSFCETRLIGLVKALQEIESLLGYDALDVEFAIDRSQQVHILQVRPIAVDHSLSTIDDEACDQALATAEKLWESLTPPPPHIPGNAPSLYGVMPDWNPAEIIGTAPGNLAASIYRFLVMDEVWATQRAEYGYRDVRPAPLLVQFAGQPYVDVRASFASFLPASLPDELAGRLLNFYLDWLRERPELHDKVEFEVVPTCLGPGYSRWEKRLCTEGGFSGYEIAQLKQGLQTITAHAFDRCSDDLEKIDLLATRYKAIMADRRLLAVERARLLLDDCRRLGTLPFAHLARSGFVAVTLLREAQAVGTITQEARDRFLSSVRTVSHELSQHAREVAQGVFSWDEFVGRYGHLRPGTYDINSPRYDADPERFLRPLIAHAAAAQPEHEDLGPWMEQRGDFCRALKALDLPNEPEEVESFLRQAIEGREYAKFVFSRNLSSALEALAEFGASLQLTREQVSDLSLNELIAARYEAENDNEISLRLQQQAARANQLRKVSMACKLPPLLTKKSDLHAFVLGADRPNFIGSATVTADCIELGSQKPGGFLRVEGCIVMIPQADPGYDWLFGQGIVGLVTLFGGANSHMAIRAAEFGLPAAIGVGEQRYRELAQARAIELAPGNGILRALR